MELQNDLTLKMEPSAPLRIRTLLVDDFQPFRRFLSSILQQRAHIEIVGEAGNGIEAVQMVQQLCPDLVLLDIGLPQLNGIEAARQIRALSPASKIVFITLTSDAAVIAKAFEAGAAAYIIKMDAGREVLPAIDAVLRGEIFLGRRFAPADSPEANCKFQSNPTEPT